MDANCGRHPLTPLTGLMQPRHLVVSARRPLYGMFWSMLCIPFTRDSLLIVTSNKKWDKSEYAWDADAWADVFGKMRDDPVVAAFVPHLPARIHMSPSQRAHLLLTEIQRQAQILLLGEYPS